MSMEVFSGLFFFPFPKKSHVLLNAYPGFCVEPTLPEDCLTSQPTIQAGYGQPLTL